MARSRAAGRPSRAIGGRTPSPGPEKVVILGGLARRRRLIASIALIVTAGFLIAAQAPRNPSAVAADHGQPEPPVRAAFMYPWYPAAWGSEGSSPRSHFTPADGRYDSADPAVIDRQVSQATSAGLDAFITPWWGPDDEAETGLVALLDRIPDSPNPGFRVAIHYQEEGLSDPSPAAIENDLGYLESIFDKPSYLRVDGKPVVFVWADSSDRAEMATRWSNAKDLYGDDLHVVLKVFSGYRNISDPPDSWHQFGAASNYSEQLPYSATVSPGFWHFNDASPRLERDADRFRRDVRSMAASDAFWQLITTWNNWTQGSMIEESTELGSAYLDVLIEELGDDTPPAATTPVTFVPTADSYVNADHAGRNYGSIVRMRVDGSPDQRAYVQFDVSGLTGPVASATLRVYAHSHRPPGFAVQGVSDNTWEETSITYSNAPDFGPVLGTSGRVQTETYSEIDVTGYVDGNGTFSFALTALSNTNLPLATRETVHPAELVVVQDISPPPPPPSTTTPPPPEGSITFAAGGDFGATGASDATFASIAASEAEFLLALGDLSYDDATEAEWCEYVKGYLGDTFPVQLVVGNHEDDDRPDGYIGNFAACLPDRMSSTGVYAAEYYFDLPGLARIIMIGAGNDVDGEEYDYELGNSHYQWLETAIDEARTAELPWVIVGMHKVCISAGNKSCEVGTDLFDLLLDKKVDLILHGHDHDYQRSKQLSCATPEDYRGECVVDDGSDGRYTKGAGSVFVVNGNTGGGGLTEIDPSDPDFPYLAEWHGANSTDPGRGHLIVEMTADSLQVRFVGSTTSYTDSFTID